MRHRDEDVGHFFLAEKADGEASTDDDQEVLTLFASQAAAAITNARTHRRPSSRHGNLDNVQTRPRAGPRERFFLPPGGGPAA